MTYQEIFDQTTQLVGQELGPDDFDRLLLHTQRKIENKREWMMLKAFDVSLTFRASDYAAGALTAKALPQTILDSMEFLAERPVVLIDSAGNEYEVDQVPIEAKQTYYNYFGKYFIDYYNGTITLTGLANQTYTVRIGFKRVPPAVAAAQNWIFPGRFHGLLPFGASILYKKGVDYDFINALQSAQGQEPEYYEIWEDMMMWDAKMQVDSLKGLDRRVRGTNTFVSGQLNNTNN